MPPKTTRVNKDRKKEILYRELLFMVTSGKPGKQKIKDILSIIASKVKVSGKLLYLAEGTEGKLTSFASGGGKKRTILSASKEGLVAVARHTGKYIVLPDASKSREYSPRMDIAVKKNERAIAVFPIKMGNSLIGVLELNSKSFSPADIDLLNLMVQFLSIVCAHEIHLERIEELTITDELSGLFNARYLLRILEMEVRRAERYEGEFSVIFVDLDNFKKVNDNHGHLVGSRILQEVGRLLGNSIRVEVDSAFRYGGDEFVLLLPNTNRGGAAVVARRLQYLIKSRTFRDDEGEPFNLTASFGIATFPRDAHNKEEMLRLADEAMYRVKGRGRDGICFSLEDSKSN